MLTQVESIKSQIMEALEGGLLDQAGVLLAALQDASADDPQTWTLTANFFLLQGNTRAAEEALLVAHRSDAAAFEPLFMLADLYLKTGRSPEAVALFRRARQAAPDDYRQLVDEVLEGLGAAGVAEAPVRPRLAVFVRAGLDQFLDSLLDRLQEHYEIRKEVVTDPAQIEPVMRWADLCWFEWCDELLAHATRLDLAKQKRIVCRLHRYEVFTDVPAKVNWERVDRLVLVTDHLRHLLSGAAPGIEDRVAIEVIHNGIDLQRYTFGERRPGFRLAFSGFLHARKNPLLMLQIMARLVKRDARYQLYVAGAFQDPLLELYWNYQVREMGLEAHVHFDGWQEDMALWLRDKDFFLSTSIHESFGYSIAEAMAMGVKPVVHNFLMARDVWPEEMLFNTVGEAVEMITSDAYESRLYRAFIEEHYSLERQAAGVRRLLEGLAGQEKAADIPAMFRPGALGRMVERIQEMRPV